MSNQIETIQFNNQSLIAIEQNGNHYVAMKPICENIGLAWHAQYERIKRDEVLSQGILIIRTPSNGGEQQMVCLPIDYLNGWLFGIDIKRVKPEIRDTLIKYKKECYQALHNYWFNGKAERPMPMPKKTLELTWQNIHSLAWLWFSHGRMLNLLSDLSPALQSIRSEFTPKVHSHIHEYRHLYQEVEPIMQALLSEFPIDTYNRHGLNRVLQELQTQPTQRLSKR